MDLLMEQSARLGACSVSGSSAAPATSPTCVQLFRDTECLRIPISALCLITWAAGASAGHPRNCSDFGSGFSPIQSPPASEDGFAL
ncbi:hypothetical protein CapIbe_001683 [Capra ibex]